MNQKLEYVAFALKYRPRNFSEVVGQEHVVIALKNAIRSQRVHHAYLFTGPRGVGKTSLARIFAKSLNCDRGISEVPCDKCVSCQAITQGNSLDVIEIDGASNRGIDEIRTLREAVKLSPVHSRYKIYIIDEVHMLTPEAFNALLKTLEEPPSHVKFIFATTHPQKVIPTILSRCQKFQFTLFSSELIVAKLKTIVKREKLTIEEGVLHSIARAGQGSIRDAESLLDQIVPIIMEKKEVLDILSFLGIIDEETLNIFLGYLIEHDTASGLDFINKIVQAGKDLGIFVNGLIEHLRCMLLAQTSKKTFKGIQYLSPATKEFLLQCAQKITVNDALRLADLLLEVKDLSHKLNSVRIPLELAVIKFSHSVSRVSAPHHSSYEETRKQIKKVSVKREVSQNRSSHPATMTKKSSLNELEKDLENLDIHTSGAVTPIPEENKPAVGEQLRGTGEATVRLSQIEREWPAIIKEIGKSRMSLAAYLREAVLEKVQDNILIIAFPKKYKFHKDSVDSKKNLLFISEVIRRHSGIDIGVKCLLTDTVEKRDLAFEPEIRVSSESEVTPDENEFINELLDTFKGNLQTEE